MKNKGISMIILIITMVVIIVIGTTIVVNISKSNVVENANKATFENNVAVVQETLNMYVNEIFVEDGEIPVIYTDDTFSEKVIDEICINSEDETIGQVYYKTSKNNYCIVFGKEGKAKINNNIEVAAISNVKAKKIKYKYTNQMLPTYNNKKIKWYIKTDNKVATVLGYVNTKKELVEIKTDLDNEDKNWTNENINVTLNYSSLPKDYVLQYKLGASDWQDYKGIIELTENAQVSARIYNKTTNKEKANNQRNITYIDKETPLNAVFEVETKELTFDKTLDVKVKLKDEISGIDLDNCKWVLSVSENALGTDISLYTGGRFTKQEETISLNFPEEKNYYLHILSYDNAGNSIETISNQIVVDLVSDSSSEFDFETLKLMFFKNIFRKIFKIYWFCIT